MDTVNAEISKYQKYIATNLTFSEYVNKFYVNNVDKKTNLLTENQLWIGFLDYYTRIFDFDKYVVDIRTEKLRKRTNDLKSLMSIQDPFVTDKNLADNAKSKL